MEVAFLFKRKILSTLFALGIAFASIGRAGAEQPQPMTFQGYAPPVPAIMGTAWTIFGDGVIDEGTSDRLHKFLTEHEVPYSSTLYLNSLGGSLAEAIKLGRLIRRSELFTTVGVSGDKLHEIKPGECYSACAIAFLGGRYRFIHKGSTYGVHRFYASANGGTMTADDAQIISAALIEYIREMDVNPSLFTFMTEAGSDDIKLLSDDNEVSLNVVNNGQDPAAWTLESLQGILYLKGTRPTWRGMNKFLIICDPRSGPFLQIHYNAERRGKEILAFQIHNLVIDGEYPDPQILPLTHLMQGKTTLSSTDVISANYRLTPEILERISRARSVGIAMKPSEDARIFMGFYGVKFADGAPKLLGLMNACPFVASAPKRTFDPFADVAPKRASDPFAGSALKRPSDPFR